MRDLRAGHEYLQSGEYVNAYHYFKDMAKNFENEVQTVNGCNYGQARALIGLRQFEGAIKLLQTVMRNVPTWEAPYISLARIYELQEANYKLLGKSDEAKRVFKLAKNTYTAAFMHTAGSEKLTNHYQYFLNEHVSEFAPSAKTFTPSLTAARDKARIQDQAKVAEMREAAQPIAKRFIQ